MADDGMTAPVEQRARVESLDLLRGIALLGILAMNVMTFAMPMAAYSNPTVYPEYSSANRATYWIVHIVFDMKMMGLFSMLFGAGVVLWSRKPAPPPGAPSLRALWLRRMAWLLVIGMIHAWWIWEGDILVSYAVCGLTVLWWLRRLPARWLLIAAGGFFLVHLLLSGLFAYQTWFLFSPSEAAEEARRSVVESGAVTAEKLREQQLESLAFSDPTPGQIADEIRTLRGSWTEVFRARAEFTLMMQGIFLPLFLFWRATALMLLGAALTKVGVLTGERSVGFYARLAAVGYGIGLPLVVGGILYNESRGFEPVSFGFPGQWFNLIGAVPVMLGHVGLAMVLVKRGVLASLIAALARVGQMALTNYLMQSVLCSVLFYGWGMGLAGGVDRHHQEMLVVAIWIVEILWSTLWLRWCRFGPAEWLWRSLTYWRPQPLLRARALAGAPA